MKTAKKTISTVELTCPHCGEVINHPHTGSEFWTVEELELIGATVDCTSCDHEVRVPKVNR